MNADYHKNFSKGLHDFNSDELKKMAMVAVCVCGFLLWITLFMFGNAGNMDNCRFDVAALAVVEEYAPAEDVRNNVVTDLNSGLVPRVLVRRGIKYSDAPERLPEVFMFLLFILTALIGKPSKPKFAASPHLIFHSVLKCSLPVRAGPAFLC